MGCLGFLVLTAGLLIAAHADPLDKGPQMFEPTENQSKQPPNTQKQHKREPAGIGPKYEMKEVILYLTPTQIRALEAGQGLIDPQPPRPDVPPIEEQIKQEMQNIMNEENQKRKKQAENLETNMKKQMQLEEAINNDKQKSKEKQKLTAGNKPQIAKPDVQKREKYFDLPLQLQLIPTSQLQYQGVPQTAQVSPTALPQNEQPASVSHHEQSIIQAPHPNFVPQSFANHGQSPIPTYEQQAFPNYEQQVVIASAPQYSQQTSHLGQQRSVAIPHLEQQVIPISSLSQFRQQLLPLFQQLHNKFTLASESQLQIPQQQVKTQWRPQNYAYLYFYPQGKSENRENLPLFYSDGQEEKSKQILIQEEKPKHFFIHNENPRHFFIQEDKPQQLHDQNSHLRQPKYQLLPYEYDLQNKLEAQRILQAQLDESVEQQFNTHRLEEQKLEAHHLEDIGAQKVISQKDLESEYLHKEYLQHQQAEHGQYEAQRTQESHEAEQFQREHKSQQQEYQSAAHEYFEELHRHQMKEIEEAQKLKTKLEQEEKEAQKLDAQLEAEQIKAEELREEQQRLDYLRKLQPKRTQMHSILTPLFQAHSIAEMLEQQKASFPHHKIQVEKGFRPLQYAPAFNDEKYAREVEKILKRNHFEKQRALSTAAAIANEPPQVILSEEKVMKSKSVEMVKHVEVPVPTPVFFRVPEPFEVKVPQPYPVPLEIIRHIPVPVVKTEKVEVEKPVPIEIEKRVPVPVTKNVYVRVDRPYYVEKKVPVEIKKEVKVEVPVRGHQKLSIIRHVWDH